ncbi:MAG: hypothetical protein JWM34_3656 [Ilumatobacteraceae bacterium]|nr:hypothetical protein [Ilumatobacteraceae bacterium]
MTVDIQRSNRRLIRRSGTLAWALGIVVLAASCSSSNDAIPATSATSATAVPATVSSTATSAAAGTTLPVSVATPPAISEPATSAPPSTTTVPPTVPQSTATPDTTPRADLPPKAVLPAGVTPHSVVFPSVMDGWYSGFTDGSAAKLLRTTDGGVTWTIVPVPAPLVDSGAQLDLAFSDPSDGWILGSDAAGNAALIETHDGGTTWAPVVVPQVDGAVATPSAVRASATQVHIVAIVSTDSGTSLRFLDGRAAGGALTASATGLTVGAGPVFDASTAFAGDAGWLIYNDRAVSGGVRLQQGAWSDWSATVPCSSADTSADTGMVAADPAATVVAVACSPSGFAGTPGPLRVFVSTDGGTTFAPTAGLPGGDAPATGGDTQPALPSVAFVQSIAPATLVVGYTRNDGDTSIVRSTDGGATWTEVQHIPAASITSAFEFDAGDDLVFQTGPGQGIVSRDGGETWSPLLADAG